MNNSDRTTTGNNDRKIERYAGLISAIEFFSGRFDVEQIVEYANDFVRKLLPVERTAVWVKSDKFYIPVITDGEETEVSFPYDDSYDQIVHFHAGLIYLEDIKRFFPESIAAINGDLIIPLIMDKSLYGILLIKAFEDLPFIKEDIIIGEALMNLFATALTNYRGYKDLEQIQVTLDEKIFNLFAINQSTKALLSEKSLENLFSLSIGVFAELTQSAYTTFFIYDDRSETYVLKSSRHVFDTSKNNIKMSLYTNSKDGAELPVLINTNISSDLKAFVDFFYNGQEVIEVINPLFIVILKKYDEVVGFVTLGEKVNQKPYDSSMFELIESLASSTYIAITNATHIEKINEQKELIKGQFTELIRLNTLMKSINGATSCEQVNELVLKTLQVNFNTTMAFIAGWHEAEHSFVLQGQIQLAKSGQRILYKKDFDPLFKGEALLLYDEASVRSLFATSIESDFLENPSGLLMLPIYVEVDDEQPIKVLGVIAILSVHNELLVSEENMVKFEAITTHLAPVVYQLQSMKKLKELYQVNYPKAFLGHLAQQINESVDFQLELYVIILSRKDVNPFKMMAEYQEVKDTYPYAYPLNNNQIAVIVNSKTKVQDLEMYYDFNLVDKSYEYGKDFHDVDGFVKLFQ